MNFMDIKTLDIANGPGCRISLFVSGCRRHCKDCFNPESWDFNHGEEFTEEVVSNIIRLLSPDYIMGLTILGGEPFEVENQRVLHPFLRHVRDKYPNKSIWMYTGYTIEEILQMRLTNAWEPLMILSMIDVLVDGAFIVEQKDIRLQYCGSKNQRIIDVPHSLKYGEIIVHDQYDLGRPLKKYGKLLIPESVVDKEIFQRKFLGERIFPE